MLPDNEKLALKHLHDFYVLWAFEQWKYKMPDDGVTHEDYQALASQGLAQQKSIPVSEIDKEAQESGAAYEQAMVTLGKEMGMISGETFHCYQINQAGIDLWKSFGEPTPLERMFGPKDA